MLEVIPIPAFADNYIWLLRPIHAKICAIVDPGDAQPVFDVLNKQALQLKTILITHHHYDHTGGIGKILTQYPVTVFGPKHDPVKNLTQTLSENDKIDLPELQLSFRILEIPGHTLGHIAYYGHGMLFCGDTLFAAGCGRLFEGTPAQMYTTLQKIAALPDDTQIYCGHEYTEHNLRFASLIEPANDDIAKRLTTTLKLRDQGLPTLPSTIGLEKLTNPFLRTDLPSVRQAAEKYANKTLSSPIEVFATIRRWKDVF